jgi:hypothetical protein
MKVLHERLNECLILVSLLYQNSENKYFYLRNRQEKYHNQIEEKMHYFDQLIFTPTYLSYYLSFVL